MMSLSMFIEKCNFLDTLPSFVISHGLIYLLDDFEKGRLISLVPRVLDASQMFLDFKDAYFLAFKWLSTFNFFTLGILLGKLSMAVARLHFVI